MRCIAMLVALIALPATAQSLGDLGGLTKSLPGLGAVGVPAPIKHMLDHASDNALDKLGKPGAFSADKAIRIGLPALGGGGVMGKLLGGAAEQLGNSGAMKGLADRLNRAAEAGARGAKPIMRQAIDRMTIADAGKIATGGGDAATEYLRKSSSDAVVAQLRPLVASELEKTGVLKHVSALLPGIGAEQLTDHVARGTASGIFQYMGKEEAHLRGGGASGLLSDKVR